MSKTLLERFNSKYTIAPNGCWLWNANKNNKGYGMFRVTTKAWENKTLAHRVSYELANGKIPEGKHICHTCDTPSCVNPEHLFIGSRSDNMIDCIRKNRGGTSILTRS